MIKELKCYLEDDYCYLENSYRYLMIKIKLKILKIRVYKCGGEATDSDSPLITFEFNTPAIAQKMTDSS